MNPPRGRIDERVLVTEHRQPASPGFPRQCALAGVRRSGKHYCAVTGENQRRMESDQRAEMFGSEKIESRFDSVPSSGDERAIGSHFQNPLGHRELDPDRWSRVRTCVDPCQTSWWPMALETLEQHVLLGHVAQLDVDQRAIISARNDPSTRRTGPRWSDRVAMSGFIDERFDERTLLQIASSDVSLERARTAWETLTGRYESSASLVSSLRGGPCERLFPLLGSRAFDLALDPFISETCRKEMDLAWGLNVRLFDVIGTLVDEMRSVDVTPTALKGLALIGDVYEDHRHRHVGDADLLIDRQEVSRVVEVLRRGQWQVPWRAVDRLRFGATALAVRHATGVGLDLHIRPSRNIPYQRRPQPMVVEPVSSRHPLVTTGLQRLSPDLHTLVISAHIARPENASMAHTLVDLYRLVSKEIRDHRISPERLATLSRDSHLEFRVANVIAQLSDVFDPIPLGPFAHFPRLEQPSPIERPAVDAEARRADYWRNASTKAVRGPVLRRILDEVTVTTVGQTWTHRWTQIFSYVWQKSLLVTDHTFRRVHLSR